MEAKLTVKLWESEIRVGLFCNRDLDKSTVKSGGRVCDLPPLPNLFSLLKL